MVALAIGLILVGAILTLQLKLTQQNVRSTDVSVRDSEIRTAMDSITRDLTSGGFLFGGNNQNCSAILNYDSGAPGAPTAGYFATYPVSALAGGAGVALPFVAGGGITLNYPAAGSANRSDVLIIQSTKDGTQFNSTANPVSPTMINAAYTPVTTGTLPFSTNPAPTVTVGDSALLQISVGSTPTQQLLCMRVPIGSTGVAVGGSIPVSSFGTLMPSNFYAGFSGQFANLGLAGLTGQSISNVQLQNGKLIDLGAPANTNQFIYAYFIDGTTYPFPTLVRATINALNDVEVAGSRQAIAAGAVSMQVLFGIGTPSTGVTSYLTWANVLANQQTQNVLTVKILLVTRSVYADRTNVTVQGVIPLQSQFSQPAYTNYTPTAAEATQRFVAQEVELTARSAVWAK